MPAYAENEFHVDVKPESPDPADLLVMKRAEEIGKALQDDSDNYEMEKPAKLRRVMKIADDDWGMDPYVRSLCDKAVKLICKNSMRAMVRDVAVSLGGSQMRRRRVTRV